MVTSTSEQTMHALEVTKDVQIAAPVEIVFETLLEQLGPRHETAPGSPLPMKLEPWPGGRWYRDLGNSAGHFWGHVRHQAAYTSGNLWAAVYVVSRNLTVGIPVDG